jgi:hypothetical protein
MPEVSNNLLLEALATALETAAFISPMPWAPPAAPRSPSPGKGASSASSPATSAPVPDGALVLVSIVYHARGSGVIELAAPLALGQAIVANTLGPETSPQETEARAGDALKEIVNVTCGSYLRPSTPTAGTRPSMEVPRLRPIDRAGWAAFVGSPGTSVLDADGHALAIRVKDEA